MLPCHKSVRCLLIPEAFIKEEAEIVTGLSAVKLISTGYGDRTVFFLFRNRGADPAKARFVNDQYLYAISTVLC